MPSRRRGVWQAALSFHFAENIDLDCARKHLPPSLQKGLQPGIAGDLLAARLERLVNLVIDDLQELRRVVDILEEAHLRAAEEFVVRGGSLDKPHELAGV